MHTFFNFQNKPEKIQELVNRTKFFSSVPTIEESSACIFYIEEPPSMALLNYNVHSTNNVVHDLEIRSKSKNASKDKNYISRIKDMDEMLTKGYPSNIKIFTKYLRPAESHLIACYIEARKSDIPCIFVGETASLIGAIFNNLPFGLIYNWDDKQFYPDTNSVCGFIGIDCLETDEEDLEKPKKEATSYIASNKLFSLYNTTNALKPNIFNKDFEVWASNPMITTVQSYTESEKSVIAKITAGKNIFIDKKDRNSFPEVVFCPKSKTLICFPEILFYEDILKKYMGETMKESFCMTEQFAVQMLTQFDDAVNVTS